MKSHVTKEFRTRLERLPLGVQEQAARAYIRWRKDPYHPGLDFKCVSQRQPIYSVRVSIDYRALGLRENDQMYWFWIGTHSEYDIFLKRL